MKWILSTLLTIVFVGLAWANFAVFQINGLGGACWTIGSDGWTVQCATLTGTGTCAAGTYTGTCFVTVSKAASGDTCTSHETLAAAIADPCLTLLGGQSKLRHQDTPGFPDHLLLRKGDTWTDENIGQVTVSGKSATEPFLFGTYGTGARPIIKSNPSTGDGGCFGSAGAGSLGNRGNYIAIIGIECYNYTRDPANIGAGFSATNGIQSGTFFGNTYNWILVEDCKFSFYANNFNFDTVQATASSNLYLNRNIVVDAWSSTGHSQGIHMTINFSNIQITQNVFDHNGWNETLTVPITATMTIASPGVVTANFGFPLYNGAGVTFHSNGDTLPTGFSFATPYFIVNNGVAGANTFELSTDGVNPINTSGIQSGTHKIAWDVPDSSPARSSFNHNVYLDGNQAPTIFSGNISARGSGSEQGRPSGTYTGNLFTQNAGNLVVKGVNAVIQNNVITDGAAGTGALGIDCVGATGCSATNNLIANTPAGSGPGDALAIENGVDDGGRVTVTAANPAATTWVNSDNGMGNGQAVAIITCSGAGAPYSGCPGATTVPAHITCTASTTASAPSTLCYVVNGTQVTTANFGFNANLSLTPGGAAISTQGDSAPSGGTCGTYGQICLIPMWVALNNVLTSNIIYNWGPPNLTGGGANGNSTAGNTAFPDGGGSFPGCTASPSPNNCTVGNYNATISGCAGLPGGCTATLSAFMTNARSNSKDGPWNTALTAKAANAWIGAGFGMTFP